MKNDEERQEQAVVPPPLPEDTMYDVTQSENQQQQQNIDNQQDASLSYVGMIASSIVLLICLTSDEFIETGHMYKYGLSLASIAMISSVLGWFLLMNTGAHDPMVRYNNVFLLIWCWIGAFFMTFGSAAPFQVTGNGYFASWGLVIFSTMALGVNLTSLRETAAHNGFQNKGAILGTFTSSLVLLTAISTHGIHHKSADFAELIFALIVSLLTIVVCGAMFLQNDNPNGDMESAQEPEQQQQDPKGMLFLLILSILWIMTAWSVTFRGPFVNTGNGYFGAWGGAVTSVYALHAARQRSQ